MPVANTNGVCCFYLQGKCKFQPCRFKHSDDGNGCTYGTSCRVNHRPRPKNAPLSEMHRTASEQRGTGLRIDPSPLDSLLRRPPPPAATALSMPNAAKPMPPKDKAAPCAVCLDSADLIRTNGCNHPPSLCEDCFRQYIECELDGGKNSIRCPTHGCTVMLDLETIRQYSTKDAFEALSLRLTLQLLSKEPTYIHCSNSGCGASFDAPDGDETPIVHCPKCQQATCFTCQAPHHPGLTCIERRSTGSAHAEAEKRTAEYMKEFTRRCPKCGQGPCMKESQEQCDIATCPTCVPIFKFCWECGADYFKILKDSCKQHKPECKYYA